jgi:hypothetical protein
LNPHTHRGFCLSLAMFSCHEKNGPTHTARNIPKYTGMKIDEKDT